MKRFYGSVLFQDLSQRLTTAFPVRTAMIYSRPPPPGAELHINADKLPFKRVAHDFLRMLKRSGGVFLRPDLPAGVIPPPWFWFILATLQRLPAASWKPRRVCLLLFTLCFLL